MKAPSILEGMKRMHAHLRLLLLLTFLIQGGMYLGYPLQLLLQRQQSDWHLPPIDVLRLDDTISPAFPLKRAWSESGSFFGGEYRGERLWP